MAPSFWDRMAGLYDLTELTNRKALREMIRQVVRRLPEQAVLLECAAGTGELSLAAAPHVRQVLCTDLSAPMLDRARQKAARRGLTNVRFRQGDLLHLPEADGTFGAVCAGNVLHLLDRPGDAVAELWRVTAPGGLLLLPTFLTGEAGPFMKVLLALYRLLGFRQAHAFTAERYRALFRDLPLSDLITIPGRLPVGLAILRKPNIQEG